MEISIEQQQEVTVVSVTGSLDALTADALTAAFAEQVASGNTRLVAACGGLEHTSSAGLRALLAVLRETRQRGGDLRLAAVQGKVRRVLEVSGFIGILRCYPDVGAAVESFPH